MKQKIFVFLALAMTMCNLAFAQRDVHVDNALVDTVKSERHFIKRKVAIGRFSNETQYGKGLFYDKNNDPMGKQVLDMFSSKMTATEKFIMLERSDIGEVAAELSRTGGSSHQLGADYLLIGSITEFGRKEEGREGMFSSSKTQKVEAAVSVRLVEVSTGLVIYSDEGRGFAETTVKKNALGLGGTASYDATLMDKAIGSAIGQLVENIAIKCSNKPWRGYFLSAEDNTYIVSGGKSQGLNVGDKFGLFTQGKKVRNPQTGLMIELPGKQVGIVSIVSLGGDRPESEYSIVDVTSDATINNENLELYYIQELK